MWNSIQAISIPGRLYACQQIAEHTDENLPQYNQSNSHQRLRRSLLVGLYFFCTGVALLFKLLVYFKLIPIPLHFVKLLLYKVLQAEMFLVAEVVLDV